MTLQQRRFLVAVAQNDPNITAAGAKLGATQPALSRQLKRLEEELGVNLFVRNGRAFSSITALGERVPKHAHGLLREAKSIRWISAESRDARTGVLSIGTTDTQACYVLPAVVQRFGAHYPEVEVHLHQGTVEQSAEMALLDRIDLAVASGPRELFGDHILLPCYRWHRRIIAPKDHPLTRIARPSLRHLAAYPLITYVFSFSGRSSSFYELFSREKLHTDVAITAQDSDVIKTHVRLGPGVGLIAEPAIEQEDLETLATIDADHLFPDRTTRVGFRRGALLGRFSNDFLQLLAAHLPRHLLRQARCGRTQDEVDALIEQAPILMFQPPQPMAGRR